MNVDHVKYILYELDAATINQTGNDFLMCSCLFAPYSDEHNSNYDNRPSMYINYTPDDKFLYGCFTCSNKGDSRKLINKLSVLKGKDYSYLLGSLPKEDYFNIDLNKKHYKKEIVFSRQIIDENKRFKNINDFKLPLRYLAHRNIGLSTVDKAELKYDDYEKRIVFPVKGLNSELYGYTSRSCLPDSYFPKRKLLNNNNWDFNNLHNDNDTYEPFYVDKYNNHIKITYDKIRDYKGLKKKQCILGMHLWSEDKPVFMVEGLFGYLHLLSIGADDYFNIGCTMGANLSDHQASLLIQFNKPVYLLFDNDSAGNKALYGLHSNSENKEGAIDKLENKITLFIPQWPKVVDDVILNNLKNPEFNKNKSYIFKNNFWYKCDPDTLTLDEIRVMKLKAKII